MDDLRAGNKCAAIVLAAGLSTRMGQPKLLLNWGGQTVLQTVLQTLHIAGIDHIIVVLGANKEKIEESIRQLAFCVETVFNPDFANGEMTDSIKVGLSVLTPEVSCVLIVLGDQPQMQVETVRKVMNARSNTAGRIIVPSYQFRRGHPWLVDRALFGELAQLNPTFTMRDFLRKHHQEIFYLEVDTPSVLQDLDTPQEYQAFRPE